MDKIIEFKNPKDNKQDSLSAIFTETDNLKSATEDALFDIRTDIAQNQKITMPIASLAALGGGIASLLPTIRTAAQTTSLNTSGLYRWVNEGNGNALKFAKNKNAWGAYKTLDGTSKMAQFKPVGSVSATNNMVMPVDPVTMMIAVALFSVEQQLGNIAQMQKKILSFLETDIESGIEADVGMLSYIISNYKHNWDNEQFITSYHKTVIDIQRTARKNMNSYQKKVRDIIKEKKLLVLQSKIKTALDELLKNFKYYRLSLFAFSMSSLVEIMLSDNFEEKNILTTREEVEKLSFDYRDVYSECSLYLENMEKSSVETNILKGVSATSKAVGKFIGNIPVIKDGQVDEFLQDSGNQIKEKAKAIETDSIEAFAEMSNPGTSLFTDKMNDLIQIYNHTKEIYFDENNIYLIAN